MSAGPGSCTQSMTSLSPQTLHPVKSEVRLNHFLNEALPQATQPAFCPTLSHFSFSASFPSLPLSPTNLKFELHIQHKFHVIFIFIFTHVVLQPTFKIHQRVYAKAHYDARSTLQQQSYWIKGWRWDPVYAQMTYLLAYTPNGVAYGCEVERGLVPV
ncbi:hypothetical protein BDR22DRAFT_861865 [Usnea florida]